MRKMPIGEQSFEKIINGGYVYVDKTNFVYRMSQEANPYFLTRPRRFGKSLLISTLEAYFLGKRELFEGLAIAKLEQEWLEYPVLRLDLSGAEYRKPEDIGYALDIKLKPYEQIWNVTDIAPSPALRLDVLIRAIVQQSGKHVVVLIDEYDSPLLETMASPELNEYYRDTLRAFYAVLKASSEHLRFVLLTGVTKFAQVSVFSGLNNLRDISMVDEFASICGITQTELEAVFAPDIILFAEKNGLTQEETLAQLKNNYDGYHFSKHCPDIYNPFSVINSLANKDLGSYWFQSGTPSYLFKLIESSDFDTLEFQSGITTTAREISDFRIGQTNPVPVLYQSGYLTIKSFDNVLETYLLGFPNAEVEQGFLEALLPTLMNKPQSSTDFDARKFIRDLMSQDTQAFMARLKSLFASLPYPPKPRDEHYYQSIFYIVFTLMGQYIKTEEHTYIGRSDAVVVTADAVFIFEFKLVKGNLEQQDGTKTRCDTQLLSTQQDSARQLSAHNTQATIDEEQLVSSDLSFDTQKALAKAAEQIEKSDYAAAYVSSGKHSCKLAVIFDTSVRNITAWCEL